MPFALVLALLAGPAFATRIVADYTLQSSDASTSITNAAKSPVTVNIPHGLTLPMTVQINGGAGGVNLSVKSGDLLTADGQIDPGTSSLITITSIGGGNQSVTSSIVPAANTITGTLPAAALPAFTGDAATAAGSTAMTIQPGTVTLAKQANLPANSIECNPTNRARGRRKRVVP